MGRAERRAARGAWETVVFKPGEQQLMDEHDVAFWLRIPVDERAEVAWRLSLEQWSLLEPDVDHERRLPRSALRVERR